MQLVAPAAADEQVVAAAAEQVFVAGRAGEDVVAGAADEALEIADELIVLLGLAVVGDAVECQPQRCAPRAIVGRVAAGPAGEAVGAGAAVEQVVAGAAVQRVVAGTAREVVGQYAAGDHVCPVAAASIAPGASWR